MIQVVSTVPTQLFEMNSVSNWLLWAKGDGGWFQFQNWMFQLVSRSQTKYFVRDRRHSILHITLKLGIVLGTTNKQSVIITPSISELKPHSNHVVKRASGGIGIIALSSGRSLPSRCRKRTPWDTRGCSACLKTGLMVYINRAPAPIHSFHGCVTNSSVKLQLSCRSLYKLQVVQACTSQKSQPVTSSTS